MFQWYRDSQICYAYLEDVVDARTANRPDSCGDNSDVTTVADLGDLSESTDPKKKYQCDHNALRDSRWFTRGWTLQELVAPKELKFFDRHWACLGSKETLSSLLTSITKIPTDVLLHLRHPRGCSIAKRMSWASSRKTTRVEDVAYCLIGIFGVQLPLLYGEGDNAFIRLQKEIISQTTDQSIFAWMGKSAASVDFLAQSPECFAFSGAYEPMPERSSGVSYTISHRGLEITTGVISHVDWGFAYAILDCFHTTSSNRRLALVLDPVTEDDWNPNKATEFTVRLSLMNRIWSVDRALSEKLQTFRSIVILNHAPDLHVASLDLRLRSFIDCDWNATLSGAVPSGDSSEISLRMISSSPPGSWDPDRSILTIHRSPSSTEPVCEFTAKLCYTPGDRQSLGKAASEVFIMAQLSFALEEHWKVRFKLRDLCFDSDSFQSNVFTLKDPWARPVAAMLTDDGCQRLGLWNVDLLSIRPSINDPYRTLAIAVQPLNLWKYSIQYISAVLRSGRMLGHVASHTKKKSAYTEFEYAVQYDCGGGPSKPQVSAAPSITVAELYGSRKKWRQAIFSLVYS